MNIKSLLNKSGNDAGLLEKVSDGFLAFPRLMWLGKSVKVEKQPDGNFQAQERKGWKGLTKEYASSWGNTSSGTAGVGLLLLTPFFVAANILAAPLLGIGLILKKIALRNDPEAQKVNRVVEQTLRNEPLFKMEEKLYKKRDNLNEKIDAARSEKIKKDLSHKLSKVDQKIEKLDQKLGPDLKQFLVKKRKGLEEACKTRESQIKELENTIQEAKTKTPQERVAKAQLEITKEKLSVQQSSDQQQMLDLENKIAAFK